MTMSTPIRYGPIMPNTVRRALGKITQTMPISYGWSSQPDVRFAWWWSPADDEPWAIPGFPKWSIHLKAESDTDNGDFFTESGRFEWDDTDGALPDTAVTIGPVVEIHRTWHVMRNRSGTPLLGVTVWTTRRADGLVFLTFRFSNGILGEARPFRFQRLEIKLTSKVMPPIRGQRHGEVMRRDPETGEDSWIYPIVPRDSDQYFPIRGILTREVALPATLEQHERAMQDWEGEFLTLPATYTSFGPTKSTLPTRGSSNSIWMADRALLITAQKLGVSATGGVSGYVKIAEPFGPWQPAGHNAPYTHGGDGIDMGLGWERDPQAAMLHVELHRHFMERMPLACTSIVDGHALADSEMPTPFGYDHSRGGGDTSQIPAFRTSLWNPSATPALYEYRFDMSRDDAFHAVDDAHAIRALRHAINAWWLAGDLCAREDLIQLGEDAGMGEWSDRGVPPFTPTYDGQWIMPSLRSKLFSAKAAPHTGGWYGRGWGWTLTQRAALYCVTPSGPQRLRQREWLDDAIQLTLLVSHPVGWTQRASWSWTSAMPENETGIQSFEWPIVCHGLVAVAFSYTSTSSRRYGQIRDLVATGCLALYTRVPTVPGPNGTVGPPKFLATYVQVGADLVPLAPENTRGYAVAGESYKADVTHVYHGIALWCRVERNIAPASAAGQQWIPGRTLQEVHDWMREVTDPQLRPWVTELEAVLGTSPRFS